jgi:hypothetical protein
MKIELAPGAAKKAVANQSEAVATMMNEVSGLLSEGSVKEAYARMDYDLLGSFGRNLETLTDELSA